MQRVSWVLMLMLAMVPVVQAADLVLVEQGQPKACLVLSAQPTEAAQRAAADLTTYLEKMSGARLSIVSEPQAVPAGLLPVAVGAGNLAGAQGCDGAALKPEQVRLKASPRALVIIGGDRAPSGMALNGTQWAAYELLERLGVRWLWPGETGEVVPRRTTVTVPADLDYSYTPPIIQRNIRRLKWNVRQQPGLEALGVTQAQFEAFLEAGRGWWDYQRNGTQGKFKYGHAFGKYWELYGQAHPEWFALQPNGTRDQGTRSPERARLCVSNTELHKQVAADAIAALKADPELYSASISPNDGGPQYFCLCDRCKAWDAPNGPLIEMRTPQGMGQHVSLTDRYVKFYNAVAEIVARELPDRFLGAYAYSAYRHPPVGVKLHPNVFIGYVGYTYLNDVERKTAQDSWTAWTQAAPGGLFFRPNLFMTGMGFPVFYTRRLGEDLKMMAATGMKVTDFDTCYNHWALNGVNYYVTARLIWNPQLSVEEIMDDYCRSGFGPAAAPVRKYLQLVEKLGDELAATSQYQGYRVNQELLAAKYSDEVLKQANGLLDEAVVLAGADEALRGRVEFLRVGIKFAEINRNWVLAQKALAEGKGDRVALRAAFNQAEKAKLDFMKQQGLTWAANWAYLMFYRV
jgi:hypothetical protein